MKIKSFAKINLTLNVGKKINSGLHNIQSNSILIDLHDQIKMKINKNNKDKIIFRGPFSKAVKKNDNTNPTSTATSMASKVYDRCFVVLIGVTNAKEYVIILTSVMLLAK